MAVQKFPMTGPGLQRLEDELRTLKSVERPAVIRAIAEARTHGDLSENAEYHAARERQSFIEGRIAELEEIVSSVEVIDPSTLSGDNVKFGAHVKLVDEETDKEATYQIVGVHEADIKSAAPLGLLAAGQGADRQEGRATPFRSRRRAATAATRSSPSTSADAAWCRGGGRCAGDDHSRRRSAPRPRASRAGCCARRPCTATRSAGRPART